MGNDLETNRGGVSGEGSFHLRPISGQVCVTRELACLLGLGCWSM